MRLQLLVAMMTRTDNTIFAHYIFMDNEFFLPTVTGLPLRVALSGTFTPGIKGGLNVARDMVRLPARQFVCFSNRHGRPLTAGENALRRAKSPSCRPPAWSS